MLNRRDRTVAEVRLHLQRKDVPPETIDRAVGDLVDQGYLDDARFARRFAEDKRLLEQWGSGRIERGLLALGVDRELIAAAVVETTPQGELEAALGVLRRRFPSPPDDAGAQRRALGVLARKGYDSELAGDAIRAYRRGD